MKTRRNFITALAAVIGSAPLILPGLLAAASARFPKYEGGFELIEIYRNGDRVRMNELRPGDIFTLTVGEKKLACRATSHPYKTSLFNDDRWTWAIMHEPVL